MPTLTSQQLCGSGLICASINHQPIHNQSAFPSLLYGSIVLWRNDFYNSFFYCRFLCPAYHFLSISVSVSLFLLIIGFYVAVAMILFLLLVLVWQQQDFFSYYWLLCDSSKTSYCWFLCDNNKVSLFLCLASWVGEMLGWNLKGMCMNDEVLELSGKWWKWMDIICYIVNGNG